MRDPAGSALTVGIRDHAGLRVVLGASDPRRPVNACIRDDSSYLEKQKKRQLTSGATRLMTARTRGTRTGVSPGAIGVSTQSFV